MSSRRDKVGAVVVARAVKIAPEKTEDVCQLVGHPRHKLALGLTGKS